MENWSIWESDYRFMGIVWESAPISSGQLVTLCRDKLGWKKSTTYNAIRRMCLKGLIKNENATVEIIVPKEKVQAMESRAFLERVFEGSLPSLFSSFLSGKALSQKEANELKRMIDASKEDEDDA
jgi:BlaI family penicillinase repressor